MTKGGPESDERIFSLCEDFERRLEMFGREVAESNRSYYAFLTIHHEYATRPKLKEACDSAWTFMVSVLGALQTTLVIALGRIFDDDKRAESSVRNLLGFAKRHREVFTSQTLRSRASTIAYVSIRLEANLIGYREPEVSEFRDIERLLKPHAQAYFDKLRPIRHQWLAHREIGAPDAKRLFGGTNLAEIEAMLHFLTEVHDALRRMYMEGARLTINAEALTPESEKTHPLEPLPISFDQLLVRQQAREFLARIGAPPTDQP